MQGFFRRTELNQVQAPELLLPQCGLCKLYKGCQSPKMQPTGNNQRGVMIIGEAPGRYEDLEGRQFVGETGTLLRTVLREIGVSMRKDCVLTNALACRPKDNVIPKPAMVDYCRPNVINAIKEYNPHVIILLGSKAIKSVIGRYWHDNKVGGPKRWAGFQIPSISLNAWVCPTFHPSFVNRQTRDAGLYRMVFKRHLEAAFAYQERPWVEVPDYKSMVNLLYSPEAVREVVDRLVERGRPVAIDLETDRLKPEHSESTVLAASIAWSTTKAVAFPIVRETANELRRLVKALPIIAHNAKFEVRWLRRYFKVRPLKVERCTMISAHVLDCRSNTTSLKFQATVNFGQEDYNSHLEDELKSREKGGNAPNNIRYVDKKSLLTYCGLDALLTYKLHKLQEKEMKL